MGPWPWYTPNCSPSSPQLHSCRCEWLDFSGVPFLMELDESQIQRQKWTSRSTKWGTIIYDRNNSVSTPGQSSQCESELRLTTRTSALSHKGKQQRSYFNTRIQRGSRLLLSRLRSLFNKVWISYSKSSKVHWTLLQHSDQNCLLGHGVTPISLWLPNLACVEFCSSTEQTVPTSTQAGTRPVSTVERHRETKKTEKKMTERDRLRYIPLK